MNMAQARRRWKRWQRWEDQVIKLCGEAHKGLPAEQDAYNERALSHNSGWRPIRCNRRLGMGWRRRRSKPLGR